MNSSVLVIAAAVVAFAAYRYSIEQNGQDTQSNDSNVAAELEAAANQAVDMLADTGQSAAAFIDNITGGFLKISSMSQVPPSVVNNANVQAFLRVIRRGEGTSDAAGYSRLFGGAQFSGFADHPRQVVKKSGYASSAAGAYQFIQSTWDETRRVMQLADFSPANQDFGAVGRIAARGALEDVIAGRFDMAIGKVAREWASMPGSPYGQPVISLQTARTVYADAGGVTSVYNA